MLAEMVREAVLNALQAKNETYMKKTGRMLMLRFAAEGWTLARVHGD